MRMRTKKTRGRRVEFNSLVDFVFGDGFRDVLRLMGDKNNEHTIIRKCPACKWNGVPVEGDVCGFCKIRLEQGFGHTLVFYKWVRILGIFSAILTGGILLWMMIS